MGILPAGLLPQLWRSKWRLGQEEEDGAGAGTVPRQLGLPPKGASLQRVGLLPGVLLPQLRRLGTEVEDGRAVCPQEQKVAKM